MEVQRLGAASMPGRWRGQEASMPGKRRAILLQYCGNKSQPWSNFESNRGGKFNAGNPCIPRISLCRGGFPNGLYST